MNFKNVDISYSPKPVWLWNSKLNIPVTVNTAKKMFSAGFGGFAVCPSNGLVSTYLGEEWFRNISAAQECAADTSMNMWILDKSPKFPGYSNSFIQENGLEYQQKILCYEPGEKTNERTIIFSNGYHFYYDVNPFCSDVFSPCAAERFIETTYSKYVDADEIGIEGIILNSSPFKYNCIPWSFALPAEYKNEYGEELLDVLIELFKPMGNYRETRFKFWSLLIKLYSRNFLLPVSEWCKNHNILLSALSINNTGLDALSYAGAMTKFSISDIPCVEGKSLNDISKAKALMASSVMRQFNKKESMAILYSDCGHSRNFEDFKRIAEQYLVRGVSKILPASIPYSLDGFRKTTTSTAVLLNSCHEEENKKINNYFSRLCKLLSEGNANFDTLLIHNQTDALCDFEVSHEILKNDSLINLNNAIEILEKKHIPFHIGDELLLKEHAYIDDNYIVIGNQKYSTVILTENPNLLSSTAKLLSEFEANGGFIVLADSLSVNDICDNENLCYTTREFSDYKIHYFVNNSPESFIASITKGSKLLDCTSGDLIPFFGIYKFSAYESIIVIDDGTPQSSRPYNKPLKTLDISGLWDIDSVTQNSFLLDRCDLYIGNELVFEQENVYDINEFLSKLDASAEFECVFKFNINDFDPDIFINFESLNTLLIKINNNTIPLNTEVLCDDSLFSKINVTEFLALGENIISFSGKVSVLDKSRSQYEKASVYETELGLFNYEKEIGPVIISGDFSVECNGIFRKLDKNALRYIGDFSIGKRNKECDISNIEQYGFPFFYGQITLKKTFNISDTSYSFKFSPKGIRNICVEVNSKKLDTLLVSPFEYDLSDTLDKGDNEIKITLTTNLRNLFGPHHVPLGELYDVETFNFHRLPCVWTKQASLPWEKNYCFLELGIEATE